MVLDPDKKIQPDNAGSNIVKVVHGSLMPRLRGYFLAGILVTAPVSITIYLTYVFLAFIDSNVAQILPANIYQALYGHTFFPGVGLLIAVLFLVVAGWLATNILGRFFIQVSEYILVRMPIISSIYSAVKQIFEMVMGSKSNAFRETVMLQYPRPGIWSIGFITGQTQGEVQRLTDNDVLNVFVPTTPNPTSGFLLFVPRKDLVFMEMSVEDAMKLIISVGMLTPADEALKLNKK
jgi:uncharacterized membrane protein